MRHAPAPLLVPRLLYADATPEALDTLATGWPSGGVLSAEAGVLYTLDGELETGRPEDGVQCGNRGLPVVKETFHDH